MQHIYELVSLAFFIGFGLFLGADIARVFIKLMDMLPAKIGELYRWMMRRGG